MDGIVLHTFQIEKYTPNYMTWPNYFPNIVEYVINISILPYMISFKKQNWTYSLIDET